MNDEPTGILNPGVIDDVTVDDGGTVTLHVRQTCGWDGSDHLLLLVQEKLFNYLAYVADGELARRVGQPRRWLVEADCFSEPDARTKELLRQAAEQFEALGGTLRTTVRPRSPGER